MTKDCEIYKKKVVTKIDRIEMIPHDYEEIKEHCSNLLLENNILRSRPSPRIVEKVEIKPADYDLLKHQIEDF